MITFQVEKFREVVAEAAPLLEAHYYEIGMYQDKIEYDPDIERYEDMDDAGFLHIVTARDDGKLIGYYVSLLMPHLHYKGTLYAYNDIVYIDQKYRGGITAARLFKFVEKELKELGVDVMTMHMKTYAPFDSFLERQGWDYAERIHMKYIGD